MERMAILIESSNVSGLKDLPGARCDLSNWISFLSSDLGGRWGANEIIAMSKPSSSQIDKVLSGNSHKYCFVAFSGHGYYSSKDRTTKICLNDHCQDYNTVFIKPKSGKGSLIIDACRGFEEALITESTQKSMAAANSESRMISYKSLEETHRDIWFKNLSKRKNGTVTMYSCNVGESAGEFDENDPDNGGYYTSILISSARLWKSNNINADCYTTKDGHNDTLQYMKRRFPQQSPQYSPLDIEFPLAVMKSQSLERLRGRW